MIKMYTLLIYALVCINNIGNLSGQTYKELTDSSNYYFEISDFSRSLNIYKKALTKAELEFGTSDTNYTNTLSGIAVCYLQLGKMDSAVIFSEKSLTICRQIMKSDNIRLAESISNLGSSYNAVGRYSEAEPLYTEALAMMRRIYKEDNKQLATALNNNALFYSNKAKYKEAYPLINEAVEMNRRLYKSDSKELASSINSLAFILNQLGRNDEAEPYFKESLDMMRRVFKSDHSDLAGSISNNASFHEFRGRYREAEELYKELLEMMRRLYNSDHPILARLMTRIASFYFYKLGNGDVGGALFREAYEMRRRIFKVIHPELAEGIMMLAYFHKTQGNTKEAEPLFREALEMNRSLYTTDHPSLALSINAMALFFEEIGNYKEAEQLFKESLEMKRRLFRGDHPELALGLNNMAYFYVNRGNLKEAGPLFQEAYQMQKRIYMGDHINLAISMNNMAYYYKETGNFHAADTLCREILEMKRRIYKTDHTDLAFSIQNLADLYNFNGHPEKAEALYKEAYDMRRRIYKSDHPDLAHSIAVFGRYYFSLGNNKKAEPLFVEALEMYRRLYNSKNPGLLSLMGNLAMVYEMTGNNPKAEMIYKESLRSNQEMLNNAFPSFSENEKKMFWNSVSKNFESFNTFVVNYCKENPRILSDMYDMQLYTKAILFNTTSRIKKRILNSGDSVLIKKFNNWNSIKEKLVKIYSLTEEERMRNNINVDSIEKSSNDIEKELSLKSEQFAESYDKKKFSWKSVQTLLKPDEAAVEVIRFRYRSGKTISDTICYAFLIVTEHTEENPELVLIKDGNKLENDWYNEYRNLVKIKVRDTVSFERFWGKLDGKLRTYKKIYISPDGIYNKLNPSTLMLPNGKYLLDIQDIQQVNSTKDLLLGYYQTKQESNLLNSAVLIGNPNFGLEEDKVKETARKIRGEKQDENGYEHLANVRSNQLTRLPGTEKEISEIEKFLKAKSWVINTYIGDMAVKTAVKNANSPRILHIATHGLFLEDVKRNDKEIFGFEEQKMVENPLLRSGLFFTGADNYMKKENPGDVEDDNGLLTAYEALNLNLDKTELVVLSACETGLGEIQNGEGVFGLRRAFQQAGARTILMSLWKVSDDATQELMSNFYKNWVSGMTKREAFAKAQQQVRAKFPDPYYWGAFVMVGE